MRCTNRPHAQPTHALLSSLSLSCTTRVASHSGNGLVILLWHDIARHALSLSRSPSAGGLAPPLVGLRLRGRVRLRDAARRARRAQARLLQQPPAGDAQLGHPVLDARPWRLRAGQRRKGGAQLGGRSRGALGRGQAACVNRFIVFPSITFRITTPKLVRPKFALAARPVQATGCSGLRGHPLASEDANRRSTRPPQGAGDVA